MLFFGITLHAADECGGYSSSSEFSTTLSSSSASYSKSDNVYYKNRGQQDNDDFYINITEPGTIQITLTSGTLVSYNENGCPGRSDGSNSINKTFSSPTDFNLLVYVGYSKNPVNYTLDITFTPTTTNTPPRFTSTPITTVNTNDTYSYTVTTHDDDGDDVNISATTLPSWLTFNNTTNELSGSTSTIGDYNVVLTAEDEHEGTATQSFTITVNSSASGPIDAKDNNYTTPFATAISGNVITDPPADTGSNLVVSAHTDPAPEEGTLSITTNGNFTFTPESTFSGNATFTYTISDGGVIPDTDTATVTITVEPSTGLPTYQNEYTCGVFGSILTTYDHLYANGNSDQVCGTGSIAYPEGEITGSIDCSVSITCNNTQLCNRVDPPSNQYTHNFPTNSKSGIVNSPSDPAELTALEYGNISYTSNNGRATIHFNPTFTYASNNTKVMLISNLSVNGGYTLSFEPGDYYFDSIEIYGNNNEIILPNGGIVRIFVKNNYSVAMNNLATNTGSSASNLFIYIAGDMVDTSNGGGTANSKAYYYVKGDVTLNNNSNNWKLYGGLTAEGSITINGNNPDFIADGDPANFGLGDCQMCYDEPRGSNGMNFIFMSMCTSFTPCDLYVPVRNISPVPLDNVEIIEAQQSLFTMNWGDNYEVVDQDNNTVPGTSASKESALYTDLPMGFSMGLANGYVHYNAGDNYPTYTPNQDFYQMHKEIDFQMSFLDFSRLIYFGKYTDDTGRYYNVQLEACEPETCKYIQWQEDEYQISEDFENPMPISKTVYPVIELPGGPVGYDVNVTYTTADGTAVGGPNCPTSGIYDYISQTGTAFIPAGESNVTVPVQVCNDAPIELDEHFFIDLSDPQPDGVCLNDNNRTKITILAQENSPICFEDDFESPLDSQWRLLPFEEGSYEPQIETVNGDGRLRLTPAEDHIASAITKDFKFRTSQNLIIIEFDYYAYGGEGGTYGADGIANILFDSDIGGDSPTPGAMGGSLGYAQKDTSSDGAHPGFEGGWLGLGLDEYGNYRNPTEGRSGGEGFIPNSVAIRGDGDYSYGTPATYEQQGYEYLKGTTLSSSNPLADKSASDYYSGRFKMTVDARDPNHLYIRLERDLDPTDSTVPTILIDQFDAKDSQYNQGTTPEYVRYALTGSTGGANNIHEISWIQLRGNCEVYTIGGNYISGPFAALDTFRWSGNGPLDSNDKAISTKDANSDFNLIIASMNAAGDAADMKENIDVKFGIYSAAKNQNDCGGEDYCSRSTIRDFNASTAAYINNSNTNFTINEAYNDMHVRIFYCGDYNATSEITSLYPLSTCSITGNDPASFTDAQPEQTAGQHLFYHESDHFTVKPSNFTVSKSPSTLSNAALYRAGNDFNITFTAIDDTGSATGNFSETAGGTFDVNVTENTSGCLVGNFNPDITSGWGFANGVKILATDYSEVGVIDINISDIHLPCSERYAHIDCTDKNISGSWNTDTDTYIGEASMAMRFIPDHFDVNSTLTDHKANNFTYLSDDLNMSASLDMNITAKSLNNNTTANYNSACYAKAIDLEIDLAYSSDPTTPNALSDIHYLLSADGTGFTVAESGSSAINDIDEIDTIDNTIFPSGDHNGTAEVKMLINFDRKNNEPVNPFEMDVTNITATDNIDTPDDVVGTDSPDSNATFLFARAKTADIDDFYDDITALSVTTPATIIVYCDKWPASAANCPAVDTVNGKANINYWWLSTSHDMAAANDDGNITLTVGAGSGTVSPTVVSINNADNGVDNSIVVNGTGIVDINLDTSPSTDTSSWLIYNTASSTGDPSPFYRVRFIGTSGWTGHGKTGHVVDSNASKKRNNRLGW